MEPAQSRCKDKEAEVIATWQMSSQCEGVLKVLLGRNSVLEGHFLEGLSFGGWRC